MEHQLKTRKFRKGKRPAPVPFFQTPVSNVVPDLGEPMVLGACHLSAIEKGRRRVLNLCLYCGKGGHLVAHCPVKPQKAKELGVLVKGTNTHQGDSQVLGTMVDDSSSRLLLKGSLLAKESGKPIPVTALLDCGAPGSYIDQALFQRLGIRGERKSNVQTLKSVDGIRVKGGPIVRRSPKVVWQMQDFSPEVMHFDIIHSPRFQLILGMDWFRRNNPLINWVTGEVSRAPEGVSRGDCGAAEPVFTGGESTSPPIDQGPRGPPVPACGKSEKVLDPSIVEGETSKAMRVGPTTKEWGGIGVLRRKKTPTTPLLRNPHGGGTVGLMRPLLRKDLKQRELFTPSAVLVQAPISLKCMGDENNTRSCERERRIRENLIRESPHLARLLGLTDLYRQALDPSSQF